MNRILFSTVLISLLFFSCSSKDELSSYVSENNIVLPDKSSEGYFDCIDSIRLLPFSVDKDWMYVDDPFMCRSLNGWYLLDQETYHLLRYDSDGNKIFSKVIRGRGRGEVLNVGNIFCVADSVCVFDIATGRIAVYDNQGNYRGSLNSKNEIIADYVFPLGKERYCALSNAGFSMRDDHYASIMDKDFNIINTYISMPDYLLDLNMKSRNSMLAHSYGDTLRFMLQLDYNIFTLTEDTIISSYYLNVSNPIPLKDLSSKDVKPENSIKMIQNFYKNGYASFFSGFGETKRYISFNYLMNQKKYNVLIDKYNSTIYSFSLSDYLKSEMVEKLKQDKLLVWKLIISNGTILYSDEDCICFSIGADYYNLLKMANNLLDDKLMRLYDEMKDYYTNNVISSNDHVLVKIFFRK